MLSVHSIFLLYFSVHRTDSTKRTVIKKKEKKGNKVEIKIIFSLVVRRTHFLKRTLISSLRLCFI